MIDIESILAPIAGESPSGEDLRYTPVYDQVKEARREEDALDQGEWQREIKTADWDEVIKVATDALANKTKDLQLAAWLTEALVIKQGFKGLILGLKIETGLMENFWDTVYPEIEDDDLDFRAGALEFINEKIWMPVKKVPLTDPSVGFGYSWFQWQESRQVGYEKDTHDQYGNIDDNKKRSRDELIADGKVTAEDFDNAVSASSKAFYASFYETISECLEVFNVFDNLLDEKFGRDAPRMAEFRSTLEDCEQLVGRIYKEKKELEPDIDLESEESAGGEGEGADGIDGAMAMDMGAGFASFVPAGNLTDTGAAEKQLWEQSLKKLRTGGIQQALMPLYAAACSAPSLRDKTRYRLLIAKICLEGKRPDLARPIIEELHALVEELNLERWESPVWIAELLGAYYKCLTGGESSDDDIYKANELFQKLCTTDVTKAMTFKG